MPPLSKWAGCPLSIVPDSELARVLRYYKVKRLEWVAIQNEIDRRAEGRAART